MSIGKIVFSPITHCHPMTKYYDLPGNWEFWCEFDRFFISKAECIHVLMLDDWESSKGVKAELGIARELNIPVMYINKENYDG